MGYIFSKRIWARLTPALLFGLLFIYCLISPVSAAMYGDVNSDGKINVQDVAMVMRHVLSLESLSEKEIIFADVNSDDVINVQDVTLIMQKSLGLIEEFPDIPDAAPGLIKEFIVAEGLTPGNKTVIVILDTADPQDYQVKVGGTVLSYQDTAQGFRGEVSEENAKRSQLEIRKLD